MPQITERKNRRLFIEQSILNNFPLEMRARWFRYSVASQAIHPFGASIHELSVAQERMWHNYFPATYDVTDIDLVYYIPALFQNVEIDAYIDDNTSVSATKTEADLDSFWYDPLPTRLHRIGTAQKQIYPTREASKLRFGSLYEEYIAGTHIQSNLFDSESVIPWSVVTGVASIAFSTSGAWGLGASLNLQYTDGLAPVSAVEAISTQACTGEDVGFYGQFKTTGTEITGALVTVGYQGIGSAQKAFAPDQQWEQQAVVWSPPTATSTGIPFVRVEATKNMASIDELKLSDYHLFKHGAVHSSTSLPYSLRDWTDHDLSWAYVIVTGGTNLMDVDTSMTRAALPAAVTIEGIDGNGFYSTERVLIPHNGTHRSLKLWKEITGTRVDSIYPWTANVAIQLQNYQSLSGQHDSIDSFVTPYHEGPLFYSLSSTNGTSYLGHDTFLTDDFANMVDGYDFILPRYYIELTDINSSSFPLQDLKVDLTNRHLYALDAANKQIVLYDPFGHWPTQESFRLIKENRTPYPDMIIQELNEDEYIMKKNDIVEFEAIWRNRYKQLIRNRWSLHKPDGTLVGIDINGNEVAATSDYWITNGESTDKITGEFRFQPQNIQYTATNYGDFVVVLESEYTDEDNTQLLMEKDSTIFSVVNRSPLKALTIPTLDARIPVGMDLDPNGNIRLAYTNPDNSSVLDEEIFSLHYDYFFEESESKRIYLREKYTKIKIRRLTEVACANTKKVTVVNNVDTLLTVDDCCNGLILVLSNSQPVQITLPAVAFANDGLSCIIKRRGANLVTVLPDIGDTIEILASLSLLIDGDAKELTYADSIIDWILT